MDVILTIGRLFYDAAHLVAILLTVFLVGPVEAVQSLGVGAWGLSALWLALLLLDWTGRINLHESLGKLTAALLLPAALGSGELMFRRDVFKKALPPEVYLCFALLLLLLGSILLRGPSGGRDRLHRAELLLGQGCELAISEVIWLNILGGAVLLVATFGLLLVVILGELMAQNGSLFDYGGLAGILLGLLGLHLAQSVLFLRGTRLVRDADAALGGSPLPVLFIPVWNLIQASRLAHRLRERRFREEERSWYAT